MTSVNRLRGFAALSPERRKEISSKGGKSAHAKGTAHEFTSEEARAAGAKGGVSVSKNREHMSTIGRVGGAVMKERAELKDDAAGEESL